MEEVEVGVEEVVVEATRVEVEVEEVVVEVPVVEATKVEVEVEEVVVEVPVVEATRVEVEVEEVVVEVPVVEATRVEVGVMEEVEGEVVEEVLRTYILPMLCLHCIGGRGPSMETFVRDILKKPGMTDRDILAVINPPNAERNRDVLVQGNPLMPGHEEWRLTVNVGHRLDPQHIIRSNHFLVNTHCMPPRFYQYDIQLRKYGHGRVLIDNNIAHTEDTRNTRALVASLWALHPDWPRAFAYDDRSTLFTCQALVLNGSSDVGSSLVEDVCLPNQDDTPSHRRYQVTLTFAASIITPFDLLGWQRAGADILRAADSALLEFARRQIIMDRPQWFVVGGRGFSSHPDALICLDRAPGLEARRGYSLSLKPSLAGLTLAVDMAVCIFQRGGPLLNIVAEVCGCRSVEEFVRTYSDRGLPPRLLNGINDKLKNCKVRLIHLGHGRKFRELGPSALSDESKFLLEGTGEVTVDEYYTQIAARNQLYRMHMPNGRLRYPCLQTVNVGSRAHPVLIPMELVVVMSGQNFSHKSTPDIVSQLIRSAAIPPEERFRNIVGSVEDRGTASIVGALKMDEVAQGFGVTQFDRQPLRVPATLLPPPKLRYHSVAEITSVVACLPASLDVAILDGH